MARKRRSPFVLVMAIVNLVFGGLVFLCGICTTAVNAGLVAFFAQQGAANLQFNEYKTYMDKEAPGWMVIETSFGIFLLILAVMLVVAGIGLLNVRNWARWMCVAYAVGMIFLQLVNVTYELGVAIPAVNRFEARQLHGQGVGAVTSSPSSNQHLMMASRMIVVALVAIAHAIANCIIVFLPTFGESFAPYQPRFAWHDRDDDRARRTDDWDDRDWDNDSYPARRRPRRDD
jgi:hypothetical protein